MPRLLGLPVLVNRVIAEYSGLVIDRNAVVGAVGPVMIAASEHAAFANDTILLREVPAFGRQMCCVSIAIFWNPLET